LLKHSEYYKYHIAKVSYHNAKNTNYCENQFLSKTIQLLSIVNVRRQLHSYRDNVKTHHISISIFNYFIT